MKYIGIDYGAKKTGIALSDDGGAMGFPHSVLDTDRNLIETICRLAESEHAGAVVIGVSKNQRGGDNAITEKIYSFGDALRDRSHLPIHYEDEAFTTFEARREGGEGRSDASAAALILSRFLEKQPGRKTYDD